MIGSKEFDPPRPFPSLLYLLPPLCSPRLGHKPARLPFTRDGRLKHSVFCLVRPRVEPFVRIQTGRQLESTITTSTTPASFLPCQSVVSLHLAYIHYSTPRHVEHIDLFKAFQQPAHWALRPSGVLCGLQEQEIPTSRVALLTFYPTQYDLDVRNPIIQVYRT